MGFDMVGFDIVGVGCYGLGMLRVERRGSIEVVACDDCGRFCPQEGGMVLHATTCGGGKRRDRWAPTALAPEVAEVAEVPKIGTNVPLNAVGWGREEDAWHRVNSRNPKDWDRAMNRDD